MHSILESDGVSSDPNEVLCHMGTLIIEGRTPKSVGDNSASGETAAKPTKPYNEGPHCPNFMKLHNKDPHSVHKCAENSISCIRYGNLKQHLQTLQQKSPSVSIEVSLGPDCLCGELRSQSTLVSGQPSKRDVILEQWTITIGHKGMREPSSQMSVLNLYQAVRSLLHFSQLTAWYMCSNGMKPSHVIYRVGVPEDSTFISDDNFVNHDFPVADVNKTVWMKISVKTLPRMEKIPSVFCPQHPTSNPETGHSSQEAKEKTYLKPEHSKFGGENKEELMESSLPLKFQGVRKKTYEAQERKRKKYITLYSGGLSLDIPGAEFLDGMPIDVKEISPKGEKEYFTSKRMFSGEALKSYQGESSKAEYKKCKLSELANFVDLVAPQTNFSCNYLEQKVVKPLVMGLKGFSDSKSDYRTKGKLKSVSDGAGSSPENESNKPQTRTVMEILDDRMQISCAISGKHHCKWECEEENDLNDSGGSVEKPKRRRSRGHESPEIHTGKFRECSTKDEEEPIPGCSQIKHFQPESPPKPKTIVDISNSPTGVGNEPQAPKIECLPLKSNVNPGLKEPSPGGNWVRRETFESFRRGCTFARDSSPDYSSDSENELSETENPFLAAILRTTRRHREKKNCDSSSVKNKGEVEVREVQSGKEKNPKPRVKSLDLRKKFSSWRESDEGESEESQPEFRPKTLVKLKSVLDRQDLKREEKSSSSCEDLYEEISSNNLNSTKTIPVPSAHDKLKFRRSLDSAAQLVFHRCSGLPLTSSPAPVRRNNSSFSFDSSLNSVSAIKSALFEPANSLSSEDENESEGSLKSPASPGAWSMSTKQINYHSLSPLPLLGSFEESVLNGRLEPVSTVQGFTAELGASGSFCPRHLHLPVTVFFYTLGDNDKVCAPYLGHINLGKKGYNVPRSGTIQVTLFNPLRTVVKMFVVVYDLQDMPNNSHTFLRQRTLYVPASQKESCWTEKDAPFDQEDYHKYLRYLIHLRFVSGKTGRIYLHTDIRMVIFRKADEDTATALDDGETYELRSHTHGPINPKFSPRK